MRRWEVLLMFLVLLTVQGSAFVIFTLLDGNSPQDTFTRHVVLTFIGSSALAVWILRLIGWRVSRGEPTNF
jgi:hypothetical protein